MESIKFEEISIVVQGPVQPTITENALRSIREHLPGGEIILSTWEGTDCSGLEYDLLVLNQDPGVLPPAMLNTNRQIVSTVNGLKRVTRKYAVKFRTDNFIGGGIYPVFREF